MKQLSPALTAHLATGATTLCWCWRLTRRDGIQFGFTDHDRPVTFDNTTFEAASGFEASEIKDSLGLSVDNLEVTSALTSASLLEADLASGFYDDAGVEIFRVNWSNPDQHVLMRAGSLGEVHRAGSAFTAEVRGLAHYLQQPNGRLFQYSCDADLGDRRCGIKLSSAAFRGQGTITAVSSPRSFIASGLATFAPDWFARGLLTFTTGAASGQAIEVKSHRVVSAGQAALEVWAPARLPLVVNQRFTITAGCDRTNTTCREKFSNITNFRGFPHMPGNDFVLSTPAT